MMIEKPKSLPGKIGFLILLVFLMIAFMFIIRPFILPALFAALVVIICDPFYRWLFRKLRKRRYLASLIATMAVSFCVIIPIILIVGVVISNGAGAVSYITKEFETGHFSLALDRANTFVYQKFEQFFTLLPPDFRNFNIRELVVGILKTASKILYQYSSELVTAIASLASGVLLVIIFIFFFFAEGTYIYRTTLSLLPLANDHKTVLAQEVRLVLTGTFLGMLATAVAQGLLIGIGYWIAGIPNPALWAMVGIVISLVPVIGGPFMYVPLSIGLILSGSWGRGIFLLLYGVFIVSMVDNIIKPLIMREKVNIHPLLIALSLIGAILWTGPSGIIIGPMVLALLLSMLRTYRREFL